MEICLFLIGQNNDSCDALTDHDTASIHTASRGIDGLRRLVIHRAVEPASDDSVPKMPVESPHCVLQWYFDDLDLLESALQSNGAIQTVLATSIDAAWGPGAFVQQVMAVRRFATPDAGPSHKSLERCSYLVGYEGEANDFNAWLTHYMTYHPPLMAQLPGIRELEIYTRVDYRADIAWPRATAMQRNKVVFDDASALSVALASPVRALMKRDFDAFPPYSGSAPHYPMRSIYGNLLGK